MDDIVVRAMARWPDVPEVYGWLRLDRRGNWRVRDQPVRHAGMREFIGRNYHSTPDGCWFFQNGPQRVYVELDAAPYVFRLEDTGLRDHVGQDWATDAATCWIDEDGACWFSAAAGMGILDDRDLDALLSRLVAEDGADDTQLTSPPPMEGWAATGWHLALSNGRMAVRRVTGEWLRRTYRVCMHPESR